MAVTVGGQATVLTFSWDPPLPADRNGIIIGYQLSCDPQPSSFPRVYNQSMTGPVNTGTTLNVFTPGTTYTCRVLPSNSAGVGPPASTTVTTLEAREFVITSVTVNTSVMIYHRGASLSEQHTDLLICHCTKQDLSHTSTCRYVETSSPDSDSVCQQLGKLLSVRLHMHKLSFTLKS